MAPFTKTWVYFRWPFPGFPSAQLEDLVEDLVTGKAGRRRCTAGDMAVLLALFGRPFTVGGYKATPSLRVAPWAVADVEATIAELLEVASVRKVLDAGRGIDAATLTRFERAAVSLLGRLGRLA